MIWIANGVRFRYDRAKVERTKYIREPRPQLVRKPDDRTIVVSLGGGPFHPDRLSRLVAK